MTDVGDKQKLSNNFFHFFQANNEFNKNNSTFTISIPESNI